MKRKNPNTRPAKVVFTPHASPLATDSSVLAFDAIALARELERFSSSERVAFAAAAATRQLGNYERFDRNVRSHGYPREIAVDLWAAARLPMVDRLLWNTKIEDMFTLLPDCALDWVARRLAEDALASLVHAVRCLLTPLTQEAAWVGNRAYGAASEAATRLLARKQEFAKIPAELPVHVIVQRELSRQRQDLSMLRAGLLDEVERRAFADAMLTESESEGLIFIP